MICLHKKWQYLERPGKDGKGLCECMKCGKRKTKNLDKNYKKNGRYNYSWCSCGNDLIRDSYTKTVKAKDNGYGLNLEEYTCSKCGEVSIWSFDIGIAAFLLRRIDKGGKVVYDYMNEKIL